MSYDLYGDEITFNGHTVARLLPHVPVSLRARMEDDRPTSFSKVYEDLDAEHAEAIKEAEADAFQEGREDALDEVSRKRREIADEAYNKGFDAGVSAQRVFEDAASDAAKVAKLLSDLEAVNRGLLQALERKSEGGKLKGLTQSQLRQAIQHAHNRIVAAFWPFRA